MSTAISAAELFALTDRELWLVAAQHGSRRGGLIATFVSHASLVPELPRVLTAIAKQHHTWELIEASGAFSMHLLGERHLDLVWRFGLASGRETDKFAELAIEQAVTGSPLLRDCLGWLDCRVEARLDTGDRTAYLAEVVAATRYADEQPLTMQRMLKLIPADKRARLGELLQRDREIDARAILTWRQGKPA